MFNYRKRSPKTADDNFVFPEVASRSKPIDEIEVVSLSKEAPATSSVQALQEHHVFVEPKSVSINN